MTELEPEHTAIVLHWPTPCGAPDQTFMYPGLIEDLVLHNLIDTLLEEHVPPEARGSISTEISLYWHRADGSWDTQEFVSTYA